MSTDASPLQVRREREQKTEQMKDMEWTGEVEKEREIERVQWERAGQRAQTERAIIERGTE